jgi:hypothetical protein
MLGTGAIGIGNVEVHPGVRIDEVEAGDHPGQFDVFVHREVAETVMGVGSGGN